MTNTVQKFLLNDLDVRGAIVYLDSAWQAILSRREYSDDMAELLGQASVATLLMSTNIKYDGQLMLQLQSPSDLSLLVVQNDNHYHFRAVARHENQTGNALTQIAKDGLIAIMVEANKGKVPYQGVVSIEHDCLADNIETYFNQSEQLKTLLVLRADNEQAAGILLQVMPGSSIDEEEWQRLRHITETLNLTEMKSTGSETMIGRIFAEDDKIAYEPEFADFECNCSAEGTLSMLIKLGESELQEIVNADESVTVGCDFCGEQYVHDALTISALLSNKIYPN